MSKKVKQNLKDKNNKSFENLEKNTLKPSKELLDALQEGEDIINGKIKVKGYHNVKEMLEDIINN